MASNKNISNTTPICNHTYRSIMGFSDGLENNYCPEVVSDNNVLEQTEQSVQTTPFLINPIRQVPIQNSA